MPVDEIGKWSEDKLELLGKYLNAYTTIMRKQGWCKGYYYIDAFAGTGKPKARDEDEERYIDGSPRRALDLKNPFTRYIFIEKEDWRVDKLKELQKEFPEKNIVIERGDCNKVLPEKIFPLLPWESRKRAFLLLDPFGMDIAWEVIEQAAKLRTFEMVINFPVMAMNRSLPSDPARLGADTEQKVTRFWGEGSWKNLFYERRHDLFGPTVERVRYTAESLSDLFREHRLRKVFKQVSAPLVMKNSKGASLYSLIYAGHNHTARKIIGDIFEKYKKQWRTHCSD